MRVSVRAALTPLRNGMKAAPVRLRVSYSGRQVDLRVGVSVEPQLWDAATGQMVPGSVNRFGQRATEVNARVREAADAVALIFDRWQVVGGCAPSPAQLREEFAVAIGRAKPAPDGGNLYRRLDEFVASESLSNGWTPATVRKFRQLEVHLRRWRPRLRLDDMDADALDAFVGSMVRREGLRNSTAVKQLSFLRWFLRWCVRRGYLSDSSFDDYRPHLKGVKTSKYKDIVFLEWAELMAVWSLDLSRRPGLAAVRDVFCFQCFTGLRFSDVEALQRSDVFPSYIRVVTKKTSDALKIELNKFSRAILDRYADADLPRGRALPVYANAKCNAYLKEIALLAGLDTPTRVVWFQANERREEVRPKWKLITTHCGRRTFVVNALRLGVSAEVVMKWTGHSSFSAMKPYVAIVDELKAESMARFDSLPDVPATDGGLPGASGDGTGKST